MAVIDPGDAMRDKPWVPKPEQVEAIRLNYDRWVREGRATDKDNFVHMLQKWGVTYESTSDADGQTTIQFMGGHDGEKTKVFGYIGFYAEFTFNADGSFLNIGIYE